MYKKAQEKRFNSDYNEERKGCLKLSGHAYPFEAGYMAARMKIILGPCSAHVEHRQPASRIIPSARPMTIPNKQVMPEAQTNEK